MGATGSSSCGALLHFRLYKICAHINQDKCFFFSSFRLSIIYICVCLIFLGGKLFLYVSPDDLVKSWFLLLTSIEEDDN